MTEHSPTPGWEDHAAADLIDCARQAQDAVRRLARLTRQAPALSPADVDTVLSHLSETVAALPQVAGQLSGILDRTRDTHLLAMDGMTATTDPDLALDTARHHLDGLRGPAVETYRHLNAARNEVAHVSATFALLDDLLTEDTGLGARRHQPGERRPPTLGDSGPGRGAPGR